MSGQRDMTRRGFLVVLGAGAGGLLIGCSPRGATPVQSPPSSASPATAAGTGRTPRTGGVLIDLRTTEAPGLDPHLVALMANFRLGSMLYQAPVWMDSALRPQPQLAQTWDIVDPQTYVFKLRPGVKFHSGREMDAEDWVFSLERVLDEKKGSQWRSSIVSVDKVEALDKATVRLKLKQPQSSLIANLSNLLILPKEVAGKPKDWLKNNADGTGPWRLDSWNPGVQMKLLKHSGYWKPGQPYLDGVTIKIIADEASIVAALRAGEAHHAVLEDAQNAALLEKVPGVVVHKTTALGTNMINVNMSDAVMANEKVRQALSLAMNRTEILNAAGAGFGEVAGALPSTFKEYYVPVSELPFYEYNPEKARKLLAEAGYPKGFDIEIISISTFPLMSLTAEVLASNWKQIGINAKVTNQDVGIWADRRLKTKDYQISTNLEFPAVDPDQFFTDAFHSTGLLSQMVNWKDPQVDALIEQGRKATDVAERKRIYHELQIQIAQKVPMLFSYAKQIVDVVSDKVQNYVPHPSSYQYSFDQTWLKA